MAKAGYSLNTLTSVSLSAGVAKTILGVRAPAQFGLDLQEAAVSFDGITAGNTPVVVELVRLTFATNPPGTNSTDAAANIVQEYGKAIAHGCTAAHTWTTEPTVVTVLRRLRIHPQAGIIYQLPLGRTPDSDVSTGFGIRCNAVQSVSVDGLLAWERA